MRASAAAGTRDSQAGLPNDATVRTRGSRMSQRSGAIEERANGLVVQTTPLNQLQVVRKQTLYVAVKSHKSSSA